MGDLKPCPFCGGEASLRIDSSHSTAVLIGCATIGCFGHEQWEETEAKAIAAWNTRATPPEVTALVEALRLLSSARPRIDISADDFLAEFVRPTARAAVAKWEAAQK